MSNRNININRGTDTNDNTVYRDYNETIDTWSTAKAVGLVLGVITAIWLVIYFLFRINCAIDKTYDCTAATYVLIAYPTILALALVIALVSAIPLIKQLVINSAYLHQRGTRIHRDDARVLSSGLVDVMKTSAASEATAGMDTYSPSISKTSKDATPIDDDEFDVNTIEWTEIFKRGK